MGATLVVTSFTCTAPFVGTLLSTGATSGGLGTVALGMGVFGATMAVPFVFLSGHVAVGVALAVSALGLFGIGAAITLLTGRSVLLSGSRQLAFGAAAFLVTYGVGALFGAVVG